MSNNPFSRGLKAPTFHQKPGGQGGNLDFTSATAIADAKDAKRIAVRQERQPIPVELPSHVYPYIPVGCQPLDFRKLCSVDPATTKLEFMSFVAPVGTKTIFQAYAVFSDARDASLTEFVPTVDGQRVFPYHGDPTDNFKIALGLAPDMSNSALIAAQLILEPGQKMAWYVSNFDSVAAAMGVRMVGYFDSSALRTTPRFGG